MGHHDDMNWGLVSCYLFEFMMETSPQIFHSASNWLTLGKELTKGTLISCHKLRFVEKRIEQFKFNVLRNLLGNPVLPRLLKVTPAGSSPYEISPPPLVGTMDI